MFFDAAKTSGTIGALGGNDSGGGHPGDSSHMLNGKQFPGKPGAPEDAAAAGGAEDAAAAGGAAAEGGAASLADLAPALLL